MSEIPEFIAVSGAIYKVDLTRQGENEDRFTVALIPVAAYAVNVPANALLMTVHDLVFSLRRPADLPMPEFEMPERMQ